MHRLPFVLEPDAACLAGHFPGRPVIPGVVLLDAALVAFAIEPPLRLEQAKFLRPCLPGMALELVRVARGDGIELRVEHDGELMASARVRPAVAGGAPDHG